MRAIPFQGFFQLAYVTNDFDRALALLGEAREDLVRRGHEVALSGGNPSTSVFFYADARATLGHYLEYIYLSPERQEFHRQLPRH